MAQNLLRKRLRFYEQQIAACEAAIAKVLAADQELTARTQRLQEVKGIGKVLAATLQAHLPELGTLTPESAAALAGLAPYPVDSGPWKGYRRIRGGRKPARCALFLVAMCAVRHEPILKTFYKRLRAQAGHPPQPPAQRSPFPAANSGLTNCPSSTQKPTVHSRKNLSFYLLCFFLFFPLN